MRKVLVFLFIASASLIYNSCQKAAEKLAPKACFSFTPSTGIKAGDLVTFNSSCSENAATFNWDFGDGSTSTDASPTHTYTTAGDFTVKLEVKDAAGLSNSTTQTITVAASTNPIACFTYSPSTDIKAGTAITFHGGCSVNAATFHWDFGDGTTSTDSMVSHTFATANTFTVVLQVKNAAGAQDTASQIITVNSNVVTHSGNITANQIWYAGVHEITGEVYVDNGATLTIKPGAIIKFDLNTGLFIGYSGGTAGATLIANGKADSTILFTSAADTKTAGDWEYIGFYSGSSSNCSMKYCTVEYAGGVSYDGAIYLEHAKVTIENSYIQLSANSGLTLDNTSSFKSFTNDTVRENANYAIEIYGNYAHTIGLNNGLMTDKGVRVVGDTYTQANQTWNKLNCPYVIDGE